MGGHEHRGAGAQWADQLVLGHALGRAGELEGHLHLAAIEHAFDLLPGVEAQLVVDGARLHDRPDQFDIHPVRVSSSMVTKL